MRFGALAKGQQLRLLACRAGAQRLASSAARTTRGRRASDIRTQARGGALFRELEAQQEERSAAAVESKTPVGAALLWPLSLFKQPSSVLKIRSVLSDAAVKDLQWSRPLQIIKYPDPRLRAVNAKIGSFDSKLEQLGKELLEVMYKG